MCKNAGNQAAGVPDWRDASAYPTTDEFSLDEWHWEFLRRNHDYRRDYFRPRDSFGEDGRYRYFKLKYKIVELADPRRSVRDMLNPEPSNEPEDGNALPTLFAPDFAVRFMDQNISTCYSTKLEIQRLLEDAEIHHLFLRINLRRPLDPQFRILKQLAKTAQRWDWNQGRLNIRRPHRRNWPLYLRALDARDAGASYMTIARELPTHRNQSEQAARDVVKQAEALRNYWPY
jgi:Family of unknown function (DUF6499)